jgi:transcriptional regulator with XRE-family HTH domain
MTQKQLAEKSGISESYLSHLEKETTLRDRTATMQCIEDLALSLKICVHDLIIYPCIECSLNTDCTRKRKDMRSIEEIEKEILEYYI